MKNKKLRFSTTQALRRNKLLTLCFSITLSASAQAAPYTWDGGIASGSANWGNAVMWDGDSTPVFDNTADLTFYKSGTTLNLTNAINGDRTIRSLVFSSDVTSAVAIRTRQAIGGIQVGRILTFDADSGNASITVASTAAVNHLINGGAVTAASVGTGGSIDLVDSLDVVHNATATQTLTLGQNNDGVTALSETPITGEGGINKTAGNGTLVLAGPNTFLGGVNITAGRVNVTNNTALGAGAVTLSNTGATLRLAADGISTTNDLTMSATGGAKTLEGLTGSAASTTFGGDVIINEETAGNAVISAGADHTFTVSGDISDTAAAGIKKAGAGTVILSGNNTYSGPAEVSTGVLKLGSASAIPSGTGKGNLSVNTGSFLDLNGFSGTINGLAGTGGTVENNVASGTAILTLGAGDATANTFPGVIRNNNGAGGINGIVAIAKTGTGNQVLSGNNSYSGGTTIQAGAIYINHNNALGTANVTLDGTSSELRLNANGVSTPVANGLIVTDTGDAKTLGAQSAAGSSTFGGNITINETTAGNFSINPNTNHTLTISGNISGTTAAGVKKSFAGTLILSGNNTYTGDTSISNGTLKVNSATAIPSGSGYGNVIVNSGSGTNAVLDLNGYDLTVNGLSGGSSGTVGQIVNNIAGLKKLTIGAADASGQTYSGLIKDNGGSGGTLEVAKTGTGEQILAGANTYSGGTSITGGRLVLNNSGAAGTNTITLSDTGAQLQTGPGVNVANALEVSDTGDTKTLRHFSTASGGTYSGTITVSETEPGNFWLQVGTGATLTITGDITGTGAAGINKINPGTLTLTGSKSYTGQTAVGNGIMTVDTAYFANASTVKIGTVDNDGTLNLTHGLTDTVDKLFVKDVQQSAGLYRASDANGGSGAGTVLAYLTGSGKLDVTSNPPVTDPYVDWAAQIPNEADRDREDDPDSDGWNNLQEFLFGTSPVANTGSLTSTEKSGGNLIIRWKQLVSGATYTLLESATLSNPWVTATATLEDDGAVLDGYQPRKATITIGSGKNFYRVEGVEN